MKRWNSESFSLSRLLFNHGSNESVPYNEFRFIGPTGEHESVIFPKTCFKSPQFYYQDYSRFPNAPQQLQLNIMTGADLESCPYTPRPFTQREVDVSKYLLSCVCIGEEYMNAMKYKEVVELARRKSSAMKILAYLQWVEHRRYEQWINENRKVFSRSTFAETLLAI